MDNSTSIDLDLISSGAIQCTLKIENSDQQCDFTCSDKSTLRKHIKSIHDKKPKNIKCDRKHQDGTDCVFKCREKGDLKKHIKSVHDKIRDAKCDRKDENGIDCNYKSSRKYALEIHIRSVHDKIQNFGCDQKNEDGTDCDHKCTTQSNLNKHIKTKHEKVRDFICDRKNDDGTACEYSGSEKRAMLDHIKATHDKIIDLCCTRKDDLNVECIFKCSTATSLRKHIKFVHDKVRNVCCDRKMENGNICDYKCSTHGNLRRHIKAVHERIRDFKCNYQLSNGNNCEYNSSEAGHLETHIKSVHNKIRNFQCDRKNKDGGDCTYKCLFGKTLRDHIKVIHDKVRDISCLNPKCEMKFSLTNAMKSHWLRMHVTDVYNFPCLDVGCGALFHFRWQLNKHITSKHQGDIKHYVKREEERLRDVFKFYQLEVVYNRTVKLLTIPGETKKYAQMDFEWHERKDVLFLIEVDESSQHNSRSIVNDVEYQQKLKKLRISKDEEYKDDEYFEYSDDDESDSDEEFDENYDLGDVEEIIPAKGKRKINQLENQNFDCYSNGYNVMCEQDRMTAIQSWFIGQGETKPIVFIRYNPLNFRVDGKLRKISKNDREEQLVNIMRTFQVSENQPLTLIYMYYDSYTLTDVSGSENIVCKVWQHKDYDPKFRQFCLAPIIEG